MSCKFKIVDRFQRMRKPHFAFAKVSNFLVNLVPRVLSYPSLGTTLTSVHLRVASSQWNELSILSWKKSFLWWRLFLPGFWKLLKACWQPAEYQAFLEEKGEKKSENLLSRSPLEKPDTQTSLLKDQCISVVLRNYYFKQWIRSWTRPGPAQGEGLGEPGPPLFEK